MTAVIQEQDVEGGARLQNEPGSTPALTGVSGRRSTTLLIALHLGKKKRRSHRRKKVPGAPNTSLSWRAPCHPAPMPITVGEPPSYLEAAGSSSNHETDISHSATKILKQYPKGWL
jgi:hypothetical protein